MIKIPVNEIIPEANGSKTGIIVWDETIIESIKVLYDDEIQKGLKHFILNSPADGFHIFSRFCQFIVLFNYTKQLGISIKLSDYQNNLDNALDEYLVLSGKEWALEDRNKIMEIFEEIRADENGEQAEMVITFHTPVPAGF